MGKKVSGLDRRQDPRFRDVVGPDSEDVTESTDRTLVLRAVDVVLWVRHDMTMFTQGLKLELADIKSRMNGKHVSVPPVPPMRPPLDSAHTVVERGSEKLERKLTEKANETIGPTLEATPAQIRDWAKDAFAEEVAASKAEERRQKLEEFEAIEKRSKDDRHKLKMKFFGALVAAVAAGLVGIVTAMATYGAQAVKARELGRAEGAASAQQAPSAWGSAGKPVSHP